MNGSVSRALRGSQLRAICVVVEWASDSGLTGWVVGDTPVGECGV